MSDPPTLQALVDSGDEPHDPEVVPASGRPRCANCDEPLSGRYCAGCGQLDQPLRQPAHRFIGQSLVEFFGIDGRVWRTLGHLLFRPGSLTKAFLSGRRRRYLRPLRVYLSSTLAFFFLLSVLDPVGQFEEVIVDRPATVDSTLAAGDYLEMLDESLGDQRAAATRQTVLVDSLRSRLDSLRTAFAADSAAGRLNGIGDPRVRRDVIEDVTDRLADEAEDLARIGGTYDARRVVWQREQVARYPADSLIDPSDLVAASELLIRDPGDGNFTMGPFAGLVERGRAYERLKTARTTDDRVEAGMDLARTAIGKVPVVLFLMLPVFALLLKLIYVRRGWYYSEHLVFGLHTHAFAFVAFSVATVLSASGNPSMATVAIVIVSTIPVYFLIAQRRVYRQGWIKTVVKAAVLGSVYLLVLGVFGLTLTLLLALGG